MGKERADTRVGPYAFGMLLVFVECGSSASGIRRSLRFDVSEINLPQDQSLREVYRPILA
ncbi:MAG: hypothetical protein GQ524_04785 [Anaerolineales bacterium]|nr:hypothetical protein [Anaerolineales bacterium]